MLLNLGKQTNSRNLYINVKCS